MYTTYTVSAFRCRDSRFRSLPRAKGTYYPRFGRLETTLAGQSAALETISDPRRCSWQGKAMLPSRIHFKLMKHRTSSSSVAVYQQQILLVSLALLQTRYIKVVETVSSIYPPTYFQKMVIRSTKLRPMMHRTTPRSARCLLLIPFQPPLR
jgi:hypothetical protein